MARTDRMLRWLLTGRLIVATALFVAALANWFVEPAQRGATLLATIGRSEERRVGKVTGVQTCALPISVSFPGVGAARSLPSGRPFLGKTLTRWRVPTGCYGGC